MSGVGSGKKIPSAAQISPTHWHLTTPNFILTSWSNPNLAATWDAVLLELCNADLSYATSSLLLCDLISNVLQPFLCYCATSSPLHQLDILRGLLLRSSLACFGVYAELYIAWSSLLEFGLVDSMLLYQILAWFTVRPITQYSIIIHPSGTSIHLIVYVNDIVITEMI